MHKLDQKPLDENRKAHGEWIKHYDNGQLWRRWNYVHGLEHGLWEAYHEDGTLSYRGYMNMGCYHGINESYSNGQLNRFCFDHMDKNLLFVTPKHKELSLCL